MSVNELEKIIKQYNYNNHIGIQVKQIEKGNVIVEMPITPALLNSNKNVHGGVIAGLLDAVCGMTIRTLIEHRVVTVNLNISYLAPVRENEKLEAFAKILNQGYKLITAEAEARDSFGNIVAKAIGTFKIIYKK